MPGSAFRWSTQLALNIRRPKDRVVLIWIIFSCRDHISGWGWCVPKALTLPGLESAWPSQQFYSFTVFIFTGFPIYCKRYLVST